MHILRTIRRDNRNHMFLLAEDLAELERVIADVSNVGLVTWDPITAYMGGKLDSHKATDVRHQLGPLSDLAERTNVGFSAITHPAKNAGQRAIDQFIGSQAFIAAARNGHLCIAETEENEHGHKQLTGRTLFAHVKPQEIRQPTLAYRVEGVDLGPDPISGNIIKAARVVRDGMVDISAEEAVASSSDKGQSRSAAAEMFLRDTLANGPVLRTAIAERAAQRGFSEDQLDRAKRKIGAGAFKEKAFQGRWFWALAQHMPEE